MSTETTPPPADVPSESASWPVLNRNERRVLGVLVEKAKTTPDSYPLTLNALITACNQKNNRDPVLHLSAAEAEDAMATLKKLGLAQQITGSGRTDKYRHVVYEAWKVDKVQLAILCELLLRGPQTEGELRARASRMEPIPDLDQLRAHLKLLAERRLVVYLAPEGRRGTTVTHGFHAPEELGALRSHAESQVLIEPAASSASSPVPDGRVIANLEQRLGDVERELAALRMGLGRLQSQLAALAGDTVGEGGNRG